MIARPLTPPERREIAELQILAADSREAGNFLDAWAYETCARDIHEQAVGIKRCECCDQKIPAARVRWGWIREHY